MQNVVILGSMSLLPQRKRTRVKTLKAETVRLAVLTLCALATWTGACIDSTAVMAAGALVAMPALMLQLRALDRKGGEK